MAADPGGEFLARFGIELLGIANASDPSAWIENDGSGHHGSRKRPSPRFVDTRNQHFEAGRAPEPRRPGGAAAPAKK